MTIEDDSTPADAPAAQAQGDPDAPAAQEQDGAGSAQSPNGETKRRARRTTLFPASTFEDALELAQAMYRFGAGQPVRRITLLDEMGKSPSSSVTRQMIINSNKYGLTTGNHNAETLALTPEGLQVVGDNVQPAKRTRAKFELAITRIEVFNGLYQAYLDNRLPSQAVMVDKAVELGIPSSDAIECVETFTVNAKHVGVLRTISGAERFIALDALVEDFLPAAPQVAAPPASPTPASQPAVKVAAPSKGLADAYSDVCFYVTPIGDEGSEARKHSDLFMGSLVEPALAEFGLRLVRADQIGDAGMITGQIIEHLIESRLVIADLSFHNPNVFYELALRHAIKKPIVQISRAADRLPFDIAQVRTIVIDTTDIYTLVPQIASIQAQIAAQIRKALDESVEVENPLSIFAPTFWTSIAR